MSRTNGHHRNPLANSSYGTDDSEAIILEREAQVAALQREVTALTNKLGKVTEQYKKSKKNTTASSQNVDGASSSTSNTNSNNTNGFSTPSRHGPGAASTPKRKHRLSPYGNVLHEPDNGKGGLKHERSRMGRSASIATEQELKKLTCFSEESKMKTNQALVGRILEMFKDPASHMAYLKSRTFADDLLRLNSKVKRVFEKEPRVAFLQSPCYVFGDIHGNLEDLHFFSDNIWRLGMSLTAGNFVFLGDYVDRGLNCLECIGYLFAMKLLMPEKVFLLRGNHETRDVNGWEEHYGDRSFLYQCTNRFGDQLGHQVWEAVNRSFDRMPLAAVIDQDIFCVHGGIPRPITQMHDGSLGSRVQDILKVPRIAGINPPYEHESEHYQQVASDCIWSDPASDDQERKSVDRESGYGESLRGGGAICFGHKAVKDFLEQHNFSYIMRAHEAHADGVAVSKGGKVFTIFSTSKDHNQGNEAMAGCILVDFENLQVINRSHAYKNVYVHRRDSVSVAKLSDKEIKERLDLGLVTENPTDVEYEEDSSDEEFNSFDEDDEDDENEDDYIFSRRKSSVDTNGLNSIGMGGDNNLIDFSNVNVSTRRDMNTITEDDDDATLNDDDAMDL